MVSTIELPPHITKIPQHVAIILDGNGRWASARGMPRLFGHKKGADAVRTAVEDALKLGIPYLTLWAFSTENWKRSEEEVSGLMALLKQYLRKYLKEMKQNGVKIQIIGDRLRLAPDIVSVVEKAERETKDNTKIHVNIAFSYGGRDEITRAARRMAQAVEEGKLSLTQLKELKESDFATYLDTKDIPDPDLLIRTSGELRISNFMLWQLAYTEYVFLDVYWPDFNMQYFIKALEAFQLRKRRFGREKSES